MKKEIKNQTKSNQINKKTNQTKKQAVKATNKPQKQEKFTKIQIVSFVRELKKEFKKYKNIEKLTVIDTVESGLPKMKTDEKYFLCANQNGRPVVKTNFMLNYGYKKLASGCFVPVERPAVLALRTSKNIEFSDSFGANTKLRAGDYVVVYNKNIIGMKKSEFEENYKPDKTAKSILNSYENREKTL